MIHFTKESEPLGPVDLERTQDANRRGLAAFLSHPAIVLAVVAMSGSMAPGAPIPALVTAACWTIAACCTRLPRRRSATLRRADALATAEKPRSEFSPLCVRRVVLLPLLTLCSLALVFVSCGARATRRIDTFQAEYFTLHTRLEQPRRCAGLVQVSASPNVRRQDQEGGEMASWSARVIHLDCEGKLLRGDIGLRLSGGPLDLARGDEVEVVANLAPLRLFRNAGLSDPWPGAARRGAHLSGSVLHAERVKRPAAVGSFIDRARAHVRARIFTTYSKEAEPLARALVLGESDLGEADGEAFRQSGLMHLLAVSGTHLVIAVLGLVGALRATFVRIEWLARRLDPARASSALGAVASLAYADFSGGSGSAWRAAFMLCLVCGARSLGFRLGGAAALGSSVVVGLALDPTTASDYSFLLSALATSGLIGLGQPVARLVTANLATLGIGGRMLKPLLESLVATVSSTLPCAPVLAMMDGDMTLAALFANVVAGPLGELVALPACLVHTLSFPWPALERGLALLGSGALSCVRHVALWSAGVESAAFPVAYPSPWMIACLLSTLVLVVAAARSLKRAARLCLVGCSVGAVLAGHVWGERAVPQRFSVTAFDVGQGDALLLGFPDGKFGLVDGGGFATGRPDPGARVLLPSLRARGIEHLDLVVLSHAHPDHILGLLTVAENVPIRNLWVPAIEQPARGWLKDLIDRTEKHGGQVHAARDLCSQGPQLFGGVHLEVLAPCRVEDPPFELNDGSLVFRATHGQLRALFTGDIEGRGEDALLSIQRDNLSADYLKVAHHGSETSSKPEFVDAVRPRVAVISSGVRNTFRHPRPGPLRTFRSRGILVARTDRLGSVTWLSDGRASYLRSFSFAPPGSPWPNFHRELLPEGAKMAVEPYGDRNHAAAK